ncbi:hypothetical protein FDT66_06650 [Polaribacter aestuariivivens]|uniref:Uncharacterized protein n=1 Tax=Polaribacter aestuariivivens TaxID=2304626 RepID=A0A5S3N5M8_9FLAO|nr:hypothetical protein [Polaribacter aestuariivivens]TMM30437.1 hypothetical protein FDT66_06650 [Polaribacter aestuariivivens]
MELTTQQIHKVEEYLNSKNFGFIDLRVEILDHIISDIENFMQKNISFENAFAMTRIRWEKHFRETSSFYFGMFFSESKIVVKKAIKQFRSFYFLYLTAYILPVLIFKLFPVNATVGFANFVNGFLLSFSAVMVCYVVYIFIKTIVSKQKTTFSFILKTQYFGIIFLILGAVLGTVFNEEGELNPIFTGFVSAGFAVVFICHYFFKKHQEAIQKYKIS